MEKVKLSKEDLEVFYGSAKNDLIDFCIATDKNYDPQWFHEEIAKALMKIESGEIKRLIIEMPPRHGKSQECTINFPAWALGRNPNRRIITASYSGDLATEFGSQTRDLVQEPEYKMIFPGIELKEDSKAKNFWKVQKRIGSIYEKVIGSYLSVGVGGATTGKGADCIAAGQLVETINGKKKIEDIKVNDLVLSFNEKTRKLEYNRVLATRCIKDRNVVSLSGKLICTPEHRIYDGNKYIEAKDSSQVYALVSDRMRTLQKDIREVFDRMEDETPYKVLFKRLLKSERISKMASYLQILWSKNETRSKDFLFGLSCFFSRSTQRASYTNLPILQTEVQGEVLEKQVLFNGMQKQSSFYSNEQKWKSQVEKWFRKSSIFSRVFKNEKENKEKRPLYLLNLWREWKLCTPHKRRQIRRQMEQFNNSLSKVSYDCTQVEKLRSDQFEDIGKRTVYDIQVEKNQNFFVNGLLVHNCLIIDDPIKNQEEADSETMRNKIWNWYRFVARTRLEKNGAIIIIMTRWHQDDLVGRILESPGAEQWHRIHFPAIAEENDRFRDIGDPLWQNKYDIEALNHIREDVGERVWFSLYQQNPVASETQKFQPEWLEKTFTDEMLELRTLNRYITIDTADTKKDGADYIGVTVVDWDSENNWFVRFAKRYRLNILGLVELIFQLWLDYKPIAIGVEKKSFEDQLQPLIKQKKEEMGVFPVVKELEHRGMRKEARILGALQGRMEAGKVYFRKNTHDDTQALKSELFSFPKGKNDDLADALAYIEQIGSRPYSNRKDVPTTLDQEIKLNRKKLNRSISQII